MTRRRRLFVAGVVSCLVLVVLAATLAQRRASTPPSSVEQDQPGPVLLVPGYGGGRAGLDVLADRLSAGGRVVTVARLPGAGTGDLRGQAELIGGTVDALLADGAPSVDIVGYSAGGVVARLWAVDLGGISQARRIVTLGSPHHGAEVAGLAGAVLPGSCPAACRQLAPGSDLLAGLNRGDETPAGPRWVSIWSEQDTVVTPPGSARLDGALDVVVQDVCPGRRVAHGQLPIDEVVTGLVLRALATEVPERPGPEDCSVLAALGRP